MEKYPEHRTSAADDGQANACMGAIFLRPCVSGMTMVAVGRVRQRMYSMISVGHNWWLGSPRVTRTSPACTRCIAISIWQRHGSNAGAGTTRVAAARNVLGIAGRYLLTLVSSEFD